MKFRNPFIGKNYGIVIVMLMGFFLVAATEEKKEEVKFDFKKTSAYTHELETRPDFPVSLILARNYAYSVLALGENIDPKWKEKIIDFIRKTQQKDGGFSVDQLATATTSQNTDYALETLSYLGAVNSIDAGKAKSYLLSLRRPDGGFGFNSASKESSFSTTYFAVHGLSFLNGLDLVDKAKTAAYIKGFEKKKTGGFSYVKGTGVSDAKNTYMGVYTLKTLGALDEETKKNAVKFLASTRYTGKKVKYELTQTLEEQAFALMALKLSGAESRINKKGAEEFIKSFYIPVNGGFGPLHGYGSAPDPTFFGIQGLAELGILKRPR